MLAICGHYWSYLFLYFFINNGREISNGGAANGVKISLKRKSLVGLQDPNLCYTECFPEYTFAMFREPKTLLLNTISYHVMPALIASFKIRGSVI